MPLTERLTVKVRPRPDYFAFDTMSTEDVLDVYAYAQARFAGRQDGVLRPALHRERVAATLRLLRLSYLL